MNSSSTRAWKLTSSRNVDQSVGNSINQQQLLWSQKVTIAASSSSSSLAAATTSHNSDGEKAVVAETTSANPLPFHQFRNDKQAGAEACAKWKLERRLKSMAARLHASTGVVPPCLPCGGCWWQIGVPPLCELGVHGDGAGGEDDEEQFIHGEIVAEVLLVESEREEQEHEEDSTGGGDVFCTHQFDGLDIRQPAEVNIEVPFSASTTTAPVVVIRLTISLSSPTTEENVVSLLSPTIRLIGSNPSSSSGPRAAGPPRSRTQQGTPPPPNSGAIVEGGGGAGSGGNGFSMPTSAMLTSSSPVPFGGGGSFNMSSLTTPHSARRSTFRAASSSSLAAAGNNNGGTTTMRAAEPAPTELLRHLRKAKKELAPAAESKAKQDLRKTLLVRLRRAAELVTVCGGGISLEEAMHVIG